MPHGSIRIGGVEVLALCDGVADSSNPIELTFPATPAEVWPWIRGRHPDTVGPSGRWRLHVHAFVLRTTGRTLLFDTGFGPADAPAFAWTGVAGRLPDELADAGIEPAEIDTVLISHVHDDHVGWAVAADGTPVFGNARYVVHREDRRWVDRGDPEDAAIFERCLRPLDADGRLQLSDDGLEVAEGLVLRHAPGHTPGHQVLVVDSAGERGLLSADTANHPVQLIDPSWFGISDDDPDRAAATRAELLDLAEREDRLIAASHFPQPFGRLGRSQGRRIWLDATT